jgi:hypothetical protein
MSCPKCSEEMTISVKSETVKEPGFRWGSPFTIQSYFNPAEVMKIVEMRKCVSCGHEEK